MESKTPFLRRFFRTIPIPGRYLDAVLRIAGSSRRMISRPVLVPDRWNSFYVLIDNLEDPIEKHIYYQGYFEWKETHFVKKCLKHGDIVFDVGANIGWYTLLAATSVKKTGKVLAFEPVPESRRRLIENCSLNGCDNVKVFDFALGRARGEAAIYSGSRKDLGGASLFPADSEKLVRHCIKVVPLDEIIEENKIRQAKLCKIDIEGSEIDALDGMTDALKRRVFEFILIEINAVALGRAGYEPADLISRVKNAGYRISNIRTPQIDVATTGVAPFGNYICKR